MTLAALRIRLDRTLAMIRAPRVRIVLSGGADAARIHAAFTAPHPRFRLTQAKRWGVALVRLPADFDTYLAGGSRELVRRKRRAAEKRGFRYAVVPSLEHFDEIMEIHRSAPERQGRALPWYYLDEDEARRILSARPEVHGILDADGRLRAYAWAPSVGDVVLIETLLGHADDLEAGTMYLLISEVIRAAIDSRRRDGFPGWVMYDTFWGAGPGLASFKARLGFEQYTVDWEWRASPERTTG